ncbi:MAG: glycogen/starch synthase [Patescibacteria group bacterium]
MSKKLNIAHIASEVEPFSKSGGLANVLSSLPKAHKELGYDVIVITPLFEHIIDPKTLELIGAAETIELSEGIYEKVSFYRGYIDNLVPVYFIQNQKYLSDLKILYGAENDNARFMLFNVAALHLIKKLEFKADIIQCHDWHSGLVPYFLKGRYKKDEFWKDTSTLFTIHNLTYQLGHNWWDIPSEERDDGRSSLPKFDDPALEKVNFAKRAIIYADAINAVSETYREEIMTKDFGQELNRVLKNREKRVFGIVNGIDYNEFNPLTDPGLIQHYSDKSVQRKRTNKKWLQKFYKLTVNPDIPLICMTSRITEQKGFKLLMNIIKLILRFEVQIIIMGDGDKEMVSYFEKVQKEFPKQLVIVPFDHEKETLYYAASDIFLLPSRFEPCGINQMIALRYGCIPVVHHIGGLADTIVDYDPLKKSGNGFTFKRYSAVNLLVAIVRALETFKHKRAWKELTISSLREANSWLLPAFKYIDLYETTIKLKRRSDREDKQK